MSTLKYTIAFLFLTSIIHAAPYLEWDAFNDINSSIKKTSVHTSKNQSIKLKDLSEESKRLLSEYESDLYNTILARDTATTPLFSLMSGVKYEDSIHYQLFSDFSYSGKYWESELGYQVDTDFGADSLYGTGIGKRDREVFARVYNASFMLKFNNWKAGFNRKPLNYSFIGNQSSFLSDNPYSYDKFELKYTGKIFQFDVFSALLSEQNGFYRRLYGKHLNFIFNIGDFTISPGAMESMIDANKSDVFRYNYLYPIMPSFLNMMNTEAGGNAFICFDLLLKYANMINYYIQFGVDDFQIDRGSGNPGDEEPDMLTLTTELDYYPTKEIGIELSYNKINSWVYYVNYNTEEAYQHFGKPLGSEFSNGDNLKFSMYHDWRKIRNRISIGYKRYGWQSLNDSLIQGVYWNDYDVSEFPVNKIGNTNIVRKLDIDYTVRYSKYAEISIGFFNESIEKENSFNSNNGFKFNVSLFPQIFYQTTFDFLQ